MWTKKRRSAPPEARALLTRVRTHGWKSDAERDDLLRRIGALPEFDPEDVGWMVANADGSVRQAGVGLLQRFPFPDASAAMFPFLTAHGDAARRNVMASPRGGRRVPISRRTSRRCSPTPIPASISPPSTG